MKTAVKIVVPVIILVLAFGAYKWQMSHKPEPRKKSRPKIVPIVRTAEAELVPGYRYRVTGFGVVEPAGKVSIVSEVTGKVIWQSDKMKTGGMFAKNERMYRIDDTAYKAALDAKITSLRDAQYQLKKIEEEAAISNKEWEIWNRAGTGPEKPGVLVTYGPQLEAAKAAVTSAESAVTSAESDLAKTIYKAPFNSVVTEESIERGKVIKSGESAGTLVKTDRYEVYLPVSAKDAVRLHFSTDKQSASEGYVELTEGKESWRWPVYTERVLPDADSKTGMLKAVLVVSAPFDTNGGKKPMLPLGVNVLSVVNGRDTADMVRIPDDALREGNVVWVLKNGKAHIRKVSVLEKRADHIYINKGLEAGEKIITSDLQGVVDGMSVNTGQKSGKGAGGAK